MKESRNKRFINPHQKKTKRSFFHYLLWQLGFYNDKQNLPSMPHDFVYPNREESTLSSYQVTWINHSTFLIQAGGVTFLTDPIFDKRCSPCSCIGPKRQHQPSPHLEELPKIDFIILSHNHYDHADRESLQRLHKNHPGILWIVPLEVKRWLLKKVKGIQPDSVIELNWYESAQPTSKVRCTAVPAQHFSGRGLFDHDRSLWMGVIIEIGEKTFYFAGDTGYNPVDFKEIGKRYKKIDLSLLPIGVYRPRAFMKAVHINPEEAVTIHEEVGSLLSVGGHWKTFRLASEGLERPPFDLYCALQTRGLSFSEFRVLNPGQTISW